MKIKLLIFLMVVASFFSANTFAWQGMPTPMLHVEGRYLKNPDGQNVTLRGGWMQPTETWFNGGGRWYSNPTDWTNPSNVAGMLKFMNDTATLMSDTSPRYGRDHGWYASFVRLNLDAIGGWTHESGLVNQAQFNGWIQNFIVPYANHLKSRGLYLIISATGPVTTPNKRIPEHSRMHAFWNTVANAPGVKNADNIMFELLNEPVDIESSPGNGDWGHGQAKYFSAFRDWIQPVIDGIRNTGANNVIWVPTLEWQGSPQEHAQFPFTCTNCGVAAHYYPAYGGCYDDANCHNRLWNSNYKPAADRWPMIITENFWFPGDTPNGLCLGSTRNYGNTLRANIKAAGNVSYMVGFLGDLLDDLNNAPPANCKLSSKEGAQAAFEWWYEDNRQSSCTPTTITPYVQVNDGSWQQAAGVTVDAGAKVRFGPQPLQGDSWSWSGGGTSGTSREQTINPASSVTATATYTNSCGAKSTQSFTVNVKPAPNPNPNPNPGAHAIENGRYNIVSSLSGLYLDVSGVSKEDGADVVQWSGTGGPNQQFDVEALGDGTYSIRAAHSGKSLDVYQFDANDGAELRQWTFTGNKNQRWRIEDAGGGLYSITSAFSNKVIDVWKKNKTVGGEVKLYGWKGGANQKWSFVRVGSNPNPNPNPNNGQSATSGCGKNPALASGRRSITVNGDHREYIIDIPGNYDRNKPYRLIFAWHWHGGSAGAVAPGYYGIKDQAQGQAIFVAPDRYNTNGHDDSGWPNTNGRDIAFLRAMLNEIKSGLCIDSNRVFSTGWSYGGMMSLAVGREMGSEIRAVAPMSGALWTPFNDSGKPMAAWIATGRYDALVDFNSAAIPARDYYVKANHCSNNTVTYAPTPWCVEYQGCDAGAPVVWCAHIGGHVTPDNAGVDIWKFFSRF